MPLQGWDCCSASILADTIVPGAANPLAYNRYAYSVNSPLNFTDPSGHAPVGVGPCIDGVFCGDASDAVDHNALAYVGFEQTEEQAAAREARLAAIKRDRRLAEIAEDRSNGDGNHPELLGGPVSPPQDTINLDYYDVPMCNAYQAATLCVGSWQDHDYEFGTLGWHIDTYSCEGGGRDCAEVALGIRLEVTIAGGDNNLDLMYFFDSNRFALFHTPGGEGVETEATGGLILAWGVREPSDYEGVSGGAVTNLIPLEVDISKSGENSGSIYVGVGPDLEGIDLPAEPSAGNTKCWFGCWQE